MVVSPFSLSAAKSLSALTRASPSKSRCSLRSSPLRRAEAYLWQLLLPSFLAAKASALAFVLPFLSHHPFFLATPVGMLMRPLDFVECKSVAAFTRMLMAKRSIGLLISSVGKYTFKGLMARPQILFAFCFTVVRRTYAHERTTFLS